MVLKEIDSEELTLADIAEKCPDPKKLVAFDVKKAVNLNENTGPFLQYSYARALNIIKRAKEEINLDVHSILSKAEQLVFEINKDEEWELIKLMEDLPYALRKATETLRPDSVANFAYSLAAAFHKFYDACHVLKAENSNLRDSRMLIVYCFLKCLESLFEVIGIDYLEKM